MSSLDETLNRMVEDHIDIPSMDKESGLAWIEDYSMCRQEIKNLMRQLTKDISINPALSSWENVAQIQKRIESKIAEL